MRMQASPMKLAAMELGIPVETPEKSRAAEFVSRLVSEDADALVVASYGQILSQAVLDSARRGGINLHGSLLPKYRGAAPIQRAILNRESETGITLMQMDKGMDTGDAIAMVSTPIGRDETYGELQDRLALIAADMAADWMPRIVAGDYSRVAQDSSLATVAPKVEKAEAELSFDRPAVEEYARFRAFTPSPGATVRTAFGMVKLSGVRNWELGTGNSQLGTEHSELYGLAVEVHPPAPLKGGPEFGGTVLSVNPLVVSFAEGALEFVELQPEGKKRMSGKDFANGHRLKPGMSLRPN
jgi:methionyl-tRNA formyltransferase